MQHVHGDVEMHQGAPEMPQGAPELPAVKVVLSDPGEDSGQDEQGVGSSG